LSSAILYVAIVAIWACVLIPRWLRRDSVRTSSGSVPDTVSGDVADGDTGRDTAEFDGRDESPARKDRPPETAVPVSRHEETADESPEAGQDPPETDEPPPLTPEESRRRMLAARRRLLLMLLALEIAACALVLLRLAAMWVVIPPSVMLFGYLMLLREAARVDAEHARREEEAAYARARARAQSARRTAPPRAVAPPAPPVPRPDEYQDLGHGRDFAPGLAGKYTTSNAEIADVPEAEDEDYYDDGYHQQRLRAVGD
jgi:hypothetical protein